MTVPLHTHSVYNITWKQPPTDKVHSTTVSYWSFKATCFTWELAWFHSPEPEHQEMIWDPREQEDKSYTVSHILSPFPFLSPSHKQLSWLIYAHSCPNHWSLDMTKACTEKRKRGGSTSGSVTGRSIGLSGEEKKTDCHYLSKVHNSSFSLMSTKESALTVNRVDSVHSFHCNTTDEHMGQRTYNSCPLWPLFNWSSAAC